MKDKLTFTLAFWSFTYFFMVSFHAGLFVGFKSALGPPLSSRENIQIWLRACIWPWAHIRTVWHRWRTRPRGKDKWGDPWLFHSESEGAQVWNSFKHKRCPDCGAHGHLFSGPTALGTHLNVLCDWCGSRFNVVYHHGRVFRAEQTACGPRMVPDDERELFHERFQA